MLAGVSRRPHWPFEDPAAFTEVGDERLDAFHLGVSGLAVVLVGVDRDYTRLTP